MLEEKRFKEDFVAIAACVDQLVGQAKGDAVEQLKILRFLENLHQDIREHHFQAALPTSRHELYALLREMESEGGWPYIPRMQLRMLLLNGEAQPPTEPPTNG
jgi:hypothetical protein